MTLIKALRYGFLFFDLLGLTALVFLDPRTTDKTFGLAMLCFCILSIANLYKSGYRIFLTIYLFIRLSLYVCIVMVDFLAMITGMITQTQAFIILILGITNIAFNFLILPDSNEVDTSKIAGEHQISDGTVFVIVKNRIDEESNTTLTTNPNIAIGVPLIHLPFRHTH
eukprot:TRINITY_DN6352_c0_g1_i1.p1 TRINITY_DN6352_c0_g1~~TRINITY_DN6352_c0_g1_i1.p1  ORF type:complete len:168 (+),score=13.91 TRINITY_DN6352_c0_g1_i1:44-547(+)